jgi:MoaA/NifB/PqqE/SkfB family radical SAM enzyme
MLPIGDIKAVIDILHQSGIRTLCFGGGEPTILHGITEIIDYAVGLGFHVVLCSNGYKWPPTMLSELPVGKPLAVSIGIDGGTSSTYSAIRGSDEAFLESHATIARLSLRGIYTIVDFTATRRNWQELHQVVSNASTVGAHQVNLKRFIPLGRGSRYQSDLALTPAQQRELLEDWAEEREKRTDIVVEAQDPLANTMGVKPSVARGMMTGRFWLGLTPTLDLLPSPTMPIVVGHLLKDDLVTVWRESSLLQGLSNPRRLDGHCGQCEYVLVCGGHREHAYAVYGSPFAPDPLCWRCQN